MRHAYLATGLLAVLAIAGAAQATSPFLVTYEPEAPGLTTSTTTATFKVSGVENFETVSTYTGGADVSTPLPATGYGAYENFTTDFGTSGQITGSYTNTEVLNADQYGGAGGTGQYPVAFYAGGTGAYTLSLTSQPGISADYFGYWLSALDAGNTLTFLEQGKAVYTFSASDALKAVTSLKNNGAYFGNPSPGYTGQDGNEPFVFLNFFDKTGSFDQIQFSEGAKFGGGYESDNHTVGYDVISYGNGVTIPTGVPEPATWAMMILGVGVVGASLRRRRANGFAKIA